MPARDCFPSDLTHLVEGIAGCAKATAGIPTTPARNCVSAWRKSSPLIRSTGRTSRPGTTPSERDIATVSRAVNTAGIRSPDIDGELLTFLRDMLLLEISGPAETEMALRFQQVTSPVMAKAVEDTFFYRYMPLLALNEVGGDPGAHGTETDEFHTWCARTHARHPFGLLATSTHDTKRSQDVRARISVLSEVPEEWAEANERWHLLNRKLRVADLPDPATEWMFYQTLVGAWPISPARALGFLEKAVREAKMHTSWDQPNPIYEGAVNAFANTVLRSRRFIAELEEFVEKIRPRPVQLPRP